MFSFCREKRWILAVKSSFFDGSRMAGRQMSSYYDCNGELLLGCLAKAVTFILTMTMSITPDEIIHGYCREQFIDTTYRQMNDHVNINNCHHRHHHRYCHHRHFL